VSGWSEDWGVNEGTWDVEKINWRREEESISSVEDIHSFGNLKIR
jgi:hypothetical protein